MGRLVWRDFRSSKSQRLIECAVMSDAPAKKSYETLVAKGLGNTKLLFELIAMAAAVGSEGKPATHSLKKPAYFAKRLKAMAAEIEKFNADPLFIPPNEFKELPNALHHYADHVDRRCEQLRQGRKNRPGPMGQILDGLRFLVRTETGKERHADLARLLTAATSNLPSSNPDFDFEAALKMRALRAPLSAT